MIIVNHILLGIFGRSKLSPNYILQSNIKFQDLFQKYVFQITYM